MVRVIFCNAKTVKYHIFSLCKIPGAMHFFSARGGGGKSIKVAISSLILEGQGNFTLSNLDICTKLAKLISSNPCRGSQCKDPPPPPHY